MPTRTGTRRRSRGRKAGAGAGKGGRGPRAGKGAKKAKTYRLTESKIAAAQEILGAETATAAIETALDMVVFRKELVDGTAAMLGADVDADDGER